MIRPVIEFQMETAKFCVYDKKPNMKCLQVNQVHEGTIVTSPSKPIEADGIITLKKEILAVQTADCMPIAICGKKGHALLHVGWRGLFHKILENPKINNIEPFEFLIGPSISVGHYQVGEDFKNNFPNSRSFKKINDNLYFSLALEAKTRIAKLFPQAQCKVITTCTYNDPKLHSYRQNKTKARNWNLLMPDL